jgi:hypothetical protein
MPEFIVAASMLLTHLWYPSACASIELARRTASTPLATKGLPSQPQRLLYMLAQLATWATYGGAVELEQDHPSGAVAGKL